MARVGDRVGDRVAVARVGAVTVRGTRVGQTWVGGTSADKVLVGLFAGGAGVDGPGTDETKVGGPRVRGNGAGVAICWWG